MNLRVPNPNNWCVLKELNKSGIPTWRESSLLLGMNRASSAGRVAHLEIFVRICSSRVEHTQCTFPGPNIKSPCSPRSDIPIGCWEKLSYRTNQDPTVRNT